MLKCYFSRKIMNNFQNFCENQGHCEGSQKNSKCFYWNKVLFKFVEEFLGTFPVLQFQMDNNFTFVWHPQNYFYTDDELLYCLPFEESQYLIN